jgi:arylsulfatase A-like enzyme
LGGKTWHITEKNEYDALRFLENRPVDKPFFLHLGFYATHAWITHPQQYVPQNSSLALYANDTVPMPLTATQESRNKLPPFITEENEGRKRWRMRFDTPGKYQDMMKNMYRMATEVDSTCGAVIRLLQKQGELDNTLIIFTTDNGNFHGEHGLADKWYPHQESIKVPLIIKDPRMPKSKIGSVNNEFTLNIDLAPTILGAAGIEALPSMMGRDISVLYRDEMTLPEHNAEHKANWPLSKLPWRTEFFYEHPIISSSESIPASEALVRKEWKYFYWPDFSQEQLFDMKNDPIEDNDLSSSTKKEHMDRLEEMRKRFLELKGKVQSKYSIVTM